MRWRGEDSTGSLGTVRWRGDEVVGRWRFSYFFFQTVVQRSKPWPRVGSPLTVRSSLNASHGPETSVTASYGKDQGIKNPHTSPALVLRATRLTKS